MSSEESGRWQILTSEETLRNPWFGVIVHKVTLPDKTPIDFHMVDFPKPAVGIVPVRNDEILLLRQYRITIDSFVWAIPSGGVEDCETSDDAARRELLEETGYRASSVRPIISYNPSYGATNQRFDLYVANGLEKVSNKIDANEVVAHQWFPQAQVRQMILNGDIVDGLSIVPLALLFLNQTLGTRFDGFFWSEC